MRSHKCLCRFFHFIHIKRLSILIQKFSFKYIRHRTCPYPVTVGLFHSLISAVKPVIDLLYFCHCDIFRKVPVQIFKNFLCRKMFVQMEISHLPDCMNSGIGSPGAVDLHLISYAVFQRLFQNPLYRPICI